MKPLKRIVCPGCNQWNEITALECRRCGGAFGIDPVFVTLEPEPVSPETPSKAWVPNIGTHGLYAIGGTTGNGIVAIASGTGYGLRASAGTSGPILPKGN